MGSLGHWRQQSVTGSKKNLFCSPRQRFNIERREDNRFFFIWPFVDSFRLYFKFIISNYVYILPQLSHLINY